jgi:hypothetical protein
MGQNAHVGTLWPPEVPSGAVCVTGRCQQPKVAGLLDPLG